MTAGGANAQLLLRAAQSLETARRSGTPTAQISSHEGLSLRDAYGIQLRGVALRAEQGDQPVGLKLGFTSLEKARQMGVSDVILGVLLESTESHPGETLDIEGLIHPRIEPEIAFRLSPDLAHADLGDPSVDLLDYVTHVACAMEVIDSRFENFSFSLEDVVADNTSACRFVIGDWVSLDRAGNKGWISNLQVQMSFGDRVVSQGSTAAILGDPLAAPAAVQRLAATYGHPLRGASLVLAGAATAAVAVEPGVRVTTAIERLGEVSLRIGE